MFKTLYESALTLVYPQECRCCGNSVESSADGVACNECWNKVRIFTGNESLCEKCGAYLGDAGGSWSISCSQCEDHAYDRAFAVGIYEHALAATVLQLKSNPHLCRRSRNLFRSTHLTGMLKNVTLIVPVPLSRKRLHERGFNQAEVLARSFAKSFHTTVRNDILVRKSHTPMHRAAMDKKARASTVRNAFDVRNAQDIKGAHILLVDDVLTSGATASSCAAMLKRNGAGRIDVLTLARAV